MIVEFSSSSGGGLGLYCSSSLSTFGSPSNFSILLVPYRFQVDFKVV